MKAGGGWVFSGCLVGRCIKVQLALSFTMVCSPPQNLEWRTGEPWEILSEEE